MESEIFEKQTIFPKPGELVFHDFREKTERSNKDHLRIVQWNIERGYQLSQIIKNLKELDGDIVCLQELDIGCERTKCWDVGKSIARELKLNYVFVCEFEEVYSDIREKHVQGGGVHGNAILSKYNFDAVDILDHQFQPFNWERDGHLRREPRYGRRYSIAANVKTPLGMIRTYCVHLEVFCGILGRISQISELLADARKNVKKFPIQMILGDLNTMAHGIARLSPKYCTDDLRWRSLGYTESEIFENTVLDFHEEDGEENTKLKGFGLPNTVLRNARNLAFYDPFHSSDGESVIQSFERYNFLINYRHYTH